jgi:hypothetical protein
VDDKLTIVVLTNAEQAVPDEITHHIAGMYVAELAPLPEKPASH